MKSFFEGCVIFFSVFFVAWMALTATMYLRATFTVMTPFYYSFYEWVNIIVSFIIATCATVSMKSK